MMRPLLVVDDDRDLREAIEEVLRDAGWTVLGAGHGREALEVLARARPLPGLVLLDMMMPVLDGVGFATEMQAVGAWRDIPVIIFSASANSEEAARVVGARAYLRKPVDLEALLEVVERHVQRA
jgi:two-component system, chemotaxis family, chemotaxis protein CheY